jgi:hypothetical protein
MAHRIRLEGSLGIIRHHMTSRGRYAAPGGLLRDRQPVKNALIRGRPFVAFTRGGMARRQNQGLYFNSISTSSI